MTLEEFKLTLKLNKGHLLDIIAIPTGFLVYYRDYESYPTDIKTIPLSK